MIYCKILLSCVCVCVGVAAKGKKGRERKKGKKVEITLKPGKTPLFGLYTPKLCLLENKYSVRGEDAQNAQYMTLSRFYNKAWCC